MTRRHQLIPGSSAYSTNARNLSTWPKQGLIVSTFAPVDNCAILSHGATGEKHMVHYAGLAAGLAVTAALLAPQPLEARTIGIWEVSRSKQGSCTMLARYSGGRDGVSLGLVWIESEQRLAFLAASGDWAGLHQREGDQAPLHLRFDGDVAYSQWQHQGARFQKAGGISTIMGSWGAENSDLLAEAVTRSRQVEVSIGDTALGSFDIDGAAAAYRELRRCGARG